MKGLHYCKSEKTSSVYINLIINLAHSLRKQTKYDDAIKMYNRVHFIDPRNFSIISSLAYSYHLKGDIEKALELYHKANFIKCDDQFVNEMINRCVQQLADGPFQINLQTNL